MLRNGLLLRSPRGRVVTEAGLRHLGLPVGDIDPQKRLF
ncbi:MAG: hypothetical protein ACK5HA_17260 [Planctomycetaceae bacterium]